MTAIVSVYVTFADRDEAERIGRAVVEERLAACINILGGTSSIYRWQDRIETAAEQAALLKTSADAVERLVARIAELHSYEVPAIVAWPAAAVHPPYAEWVAEQVR